MNAPILATKERQDRSGYETFLALLARVATPRVGDCFRRGPSICTVTAIDGAWVVYVWNGSTRDHTCEVTAEKYAKLARATVERGAVFTGGGAA